MLLRFGFCGGVAANPFAGHVHCLFLYYFQPEFVAEMKNTFLPENVFVLRERYSSNVKPCFPSLAKRNVSYCG